MTLAALVVFAGVLMLAPLALLLQTGLMADGVPTLDPIRNALDSRSVPRALWNSLESAAISAVLSLIVGVGVALLVGLTTLRGKAVFIFLVLIPMMVPPHVTAIAWTQALGPSSPLLGALGLAPPPAHRTRFMARRALLRFSPCSTCPWCSLSCSLRCALFPARWPRPLGLQALVRSDCSAGSFYHCWHLACWPLKCWLLCRLWEISAYRRCWAFRGAIQLCRC